MLMPFLKTILLFLYKMKAAFSQRLELALPRVRMAGGVGEMEMWVCGRRGSEERRLSHGWLWVQGCWHGASLRSGREDVGMTQAGDWLCQRR